MLMFIIKPKKLILYDFSRSNLFMSILRMIPVDIDNFNIFKITNSYPAKSWIHIRHINSLPKEISNCVLLTHIFITSTNIVDISALSNCKNIIVIHLDDNKIVDVSPLANCTLLTELNIHMNRIEDISPLSNCTSLKKIYCRGNNIKQDHKLNNVIVHY